MNLKETLSHGVDFIKKHSFGLLLGVAGVLIIGIGMLFWHSQEREKESRAAVLYDEAVLVLVYQLPQVATNAEMVNEISQYVLAKLDSVRRKYPRTISSMRARLLLGRLYAHNYLSAGVMEAYNQALQLYNEVTRISPKAFYRGLALINKAQLLEHNADWQGALEAYRKVAREYREFYTPYAWVSAGRVGELMGNKETAVAAYETVVQKYSDSAWYGFALGRLAVIRRYGLSVAPSVPAPALTPPPLMGQ